MTSRSGAKNAALSAIARIAASSDAMNTARPFAVRARSASTSGCAPRATEDSVSGVVAEAETRPPIDVTVGASLLAWAFGGVVAVLVGAALYQRRRQVLTVIARAT